MLRLDPNFPLVQQLLIDLSLIDRHHHLAGTSRHENDIEHSMSVVVLCWYLYEKLNCQLDISLVLKYAVVHDFVERYAGDTNTFADKSAREQKAKNEKAALERLASEFAEFPSMIETMRRYEDKQDDESRFVWTVDKMQALIMGDMDDWRPYRKLGISYEQFVAKYETLLAQSSLLCRDAFSELIEHCKTTYYDKPNKVSGN